MRRILFLPVAFTCLAAGQGKTHHIVIEMNEPGTTAYNFVLGNAEHIREAFAPDPCEIEVVCHGPGIDMILKSNPVRARVERDAKSGVIFAACRNTLRSRKIDPKSLPPYVKVVPSGTAEVVRKQEAGWSYLKGAF